MIIVICRNLGKALIYRKLWWLELLECRVQNRLLHLYITKTELKEI